MKIVIMRHGEAEHFGLVDDERALTQRGIKLSQQVAQQCLHQGITHFDHVLVSPYLRAQQTWKAVNSYFSSSAIEHYNGITPYGDCDQVYDYLLALLKTQPQIESLLVISHLPLVSYLVSELVYGQTPPAFATSMMVGIEFDFIHEKGTLEWTLTAHSS